MRVKTILMAAAAVSSIGVANIGTASAGEAFEVSGNVAFTTDYRFRGISLSDNNFAVQGGFDVGHSSGLYVGTWASNVELGDGQGSTELDLYGGYAGEAGAIGYDVGVILYAYPESDDLNYYELYGSISGTAGLVDLTAGLAYVPEQDNTGDEDNTYIYASAGLPLGESPYSLGAHIGYEDGAFGDEKIDYSLSVDKACEDWGIDLSLAWIATENTEGVGDASDDAVVFTVSKSM